MFDALAPSEIKEQYEFPSKESWDAFAGKLQRALGREVASARPVAGHVPGARGAPRP